MKNKPFVTNSIQFPISSVSKIKKNIENKKCYFSSILALTRRKGGISWVRNSEKERETKINLGDKEKRFINDYPE